DRIRPNAIGDLLKPRQILVDLPRLDVGAGFEGALVGAERRVRDAVELLACRERRVRHFDRGAQPPPDADNRRGGTCEQSRPNSHRRSDVTSNGPSKGAWRNYPLAIRLAKGRRNAARPSRPLCRSPPYSNRGIPLKHIVRPCWTKRGGV